jgi:hypothetical protein
MKDLELFVELIGYTVVAATPFVAMVCLGMANF